MTAIGWDGDRTYGTWAAARIVCGVAIALVLGLAGAGFGAQPVVAGPLPEAVVLDSVDGRLLRPEGTKVWVFELSDEARSDGRRAPAGTRLQLLPCKTLEQLIADVNDRYAPRYRLSARVTRFEGTNYLLPTYFLPLSRFKEEEGTQGAPPVAQEEEPRGESALQPADPELAIPPEIVEKLKSPRPIRGPLRKPSDRPTVPPPERRPDRMLVNRVGLIEAEDGEAGKRESGEALADARFYFTPHALGWNVSPVRYELLPCSVLERALRMQRDTIESIRFSVAGLVTEFKGHQYLLLQRATPIYNYGNFGR